mgnify:CR=1 FL=1
MAICYLVRHAAAAPSSPRGDAGRVLSDEGRARFGALVAALSGELKVRRILSSPYERAVQTAELLGEACGVSVEQLPQLAAGESSAGALLALARSCGEGCALVGHNPEIGEAMAAVARTRVAVPPGTVAAVELDASGARLLWRREP